MSLGDTLRLQRAKRGGVTPLEIEAATQLPTGLYRQMEQRYRVVGDEAALRSLAVYYRVPFEDLRWRLNWPRKALSLALVEAQAQGSPLTLVLWNGETVTGRVRWWDLGAVGLELPDGATLVVQRHAAQSWAPRASGHARAVAEEGEGE